MDSSFEKEIRIRHSEGIVSVDYPVKVTGPLAWIERSKLLISVILLIAVLLYLL